MRVLVLLSTYNGGLYLSQQLDSIFSQKEVDVDILIRDDGSSDSTIQIIESYISNYPGRIKLVCGTNVGAAHSFMELLQLANEMQYDYYALSDQDDVWLEDKLISAVTLCVEQGLENDIPVLYFGRYQMVNDKMDYLNTAYKTPKISFQYALLENCATGCTMFFNRKLLSLLCLYRPNCIVMHDDWIYKVCLGVGGVVCYDPVPHMLYRQHCNNLIGGKRRGFLKKWFSRFRKLFSKSENLRFRMAKELLDGYRSYLTDYNLRLLLDLISDNKGYKRVKLFFDSRFNGADFETTMKIKFLILLGKF